jgi:hypothetical protein
MSRYLIFAIVRVVAGLSLLGLYVWDATGARTLAGLAFWFAIASLVAVYNLPDEIRKLAKEIRNFS